MTVDIELLKKYDQPGPRYTSYPTAPQFHDGFGPNELLQEIQTGSDTDQPSALSLYFHFPFCESQCYYCACNNIVTRDRERISRYLEDLKREIRLFSRQIHHKRKVVQMHWGGGTPTYLTPQQISEIYSLISQQFDFSADAEISIEIDPRRLSPEHLPTLRRLGFNRVSFGIQDFYEKVQQTVNRIQPETLSRQVVAESRDLGFDSVNIDLIYGLPYQTVDSYKETLNKVIDIDPDRLAVFNFAYVPWIKKHQKLLPAERLPGPHEKLKILKLVIEKLTSSGYVYIGMDHFAKPEDELSIALKNNTLHRNFQGYTTRAGTEVLAMGITSISQLKNAYAQNVKDIITYHQRMTSGQFATSVGFRLDEDDQLRREVITELMCNNIIRKSHFEKKYKIDFDSYFKHNLEKLDEFRSDGLIRDSGDLIEVSDSGRLVVRNIAMVFDKYLAQDARKKQPIYSRTV
ncbi:MAG: oxygen-independent coproporphyrinogen III oxidase [Calditrichaeota bacterium]|nr:oxygen-independent coproporphyrinogen III oxidase [Calditrichota bacterium]